MVRILRQQEAQNIRKNLRFCYLCGQEISTSKVGREHVIPKSLLATPPEIGAWPIILDVHQDCEQKDKKKQDSWLKLYTTFTSKLDPIPEEKLALMREKWRALSNSLEYQQGINQSHSKAAKTLTTWISKLASDTHEMRVAWANHLRAITYLPNSELEQLQQEFIEFIEDDLFWSPSEELTKGHYRSAPFSLEIVQRSDWERPLETIAGFENLIEGIWTWIRGIHAFLYKEFLPPNTPKVCIPSQLMFGTRIDTSIASFWNRSVKIKFVFKVAEFLDKWDGFTAWGGNLQYKCVWVVHPKNPHLTKCFWKLMYQDLDRRKSIWPGVTWHGFYSIETIPQTATIIKDLDIKKYNRNIRNSMA